MGAIGEWSSMNIYEEYLDIAKEGMIEDGGM